MIAAGQSVVRSEEDIGIVLLAALFQRIEDAADLLVHVSDDRKVFLPVDAHRVFGSWKRGQTSVAQIRTAADFIVVGILGQIAARNLDVLLRIHVHKALGSLTRIVRRIEGKIHEEGLVLLGRVLEKGFRIVCQNLAPVLAALPESVEGLVERRPRVDFAFMRAIVAFLDLIRHARSRIDHMIENRRGIDLHVPLARHVGRIAAPFQQLRPKALPLR